MKKIFFLTGTRADYGKIKPILQILQKDKNFKVYLFITGMHMLPKFGSTKNIIFKENSNASLITYKNQKYEEKLDKVLANTVDKLSKIFNQIKPDLVITHGDRVETLATAISSSFNNFLTCHIEGGEITGTIDEHIRHSVSKLAHIHFVSNIKAKNNLIKMGEDQKNIFVMGSPETDILFSKNLPNIKLVKERYKINYNNYSIVLYHPITTNIEQFKYDLKKFVDLLKSLKRNFIIIYPNNDPGSEFIISEYKKISTKKEFRIIRSIRFEYYLTLLKNCDFIIGNSSSGVREAPVYGVPTFNIGLRQNNRVSSESIFDFKYIDKKKIISSINKYSQKRFKSKKNFGNGNVASKIYNLLKKKTFWETSIQKYFNE